MRRTVSAIILAAGESRRMERLKPLLPLGQAPALERIVGLFRGTGISDIRVVLGHRGEEIRRVLSSLEVTWVENADYRSGMFSSITKGVETLPVRCAGFFLLPADIPLIRSRTIFTMLEAWRARKPDTAVLYPVFRGERGHPPLISSVLIPEIRNWRQPGGLNRLLALQESRAETVSVIDAFVLRDMDTPGDYDSLQRAFARYDIPNPAECEAMLESPDLFQPQAASHCREVAKLTAFIGERLAAAGANIRLHRIVPAALLHDIAKGRPDHARAGAAQLQALGFSGIGDIVATHMAIEVKTDRPLTDRDVVYLADKILEGEKPMPLRARFEEKRRRHGDDPAAVAAVLKRRDAALAISRKIENVIGCSLEELVNDFQRVKKG